MTGNTDLGKWLDSGVGDDLFGDWVPGDTLEMSTLTRENYTLVARFHSGIDNRKSVGTILAEVCQGRSIAALIFVAVYVEHYGLTVDELDLRLRGRKQRGYCPLVGQYFVHLAENPSLRLLDPWHEQAPLLERIKDSLDTDRIPVLANSSMIPRL